MTRPVVILAGSLCPPESWQRLHDLGFDPVVLDTVDAIRMVPGEQDRRFTAAVAVVQGIVSNVTVPHGQLEDVYKQLAQMAVKQADALLAELAK